MDLREMELRDTVEMMNNADYKERFKADSCLEKRRRNKVGKR